VADGLILFLKISVGALLTFAVAVGVLWAVDRWLRGPR
jgi:hypothetical protein